jgi:glyoxylase-like metal-dependent hydrolase (beta-lactamase superfamily II)
MLQLKIFSFNPLQVNAYLIHEPGGAGILIDPSCMEQEEFDVLRDYIRLHDIRLAYQLNTHGHFDHVFGIGRVRDAFHPKFLIHREDEPLLRLASGQARSFGFDFEGEIPSPDGYLNDSDVIGAGPIQLSVIHVPGHSRGGVAFYEASQGWLFSGDTLFAGGIGRTDLPGGDYDQIISSITNRLLTLPSETIVFPGHGPKSTIGAERGYF